MATPPTQLRYMDDISTFHADRAAQVAGAAVGQQQGAIGIQFVRLEHEPIHRRYPSEPCPCSAWSHPVAWTHEVLVGPMNIFGRTASNSMEARSAIE